MNKINQMTVIEEKIYELKELSCSKFRTTIQRIDGGSRRREVSDARKCIALLAREFYPEVNGSCIARMINKERSSTRKLLYQARNLIQVDKQFQSKVDDVRIEIRKTRCHYCKTIINNQVNKC